MVLYFFIKCVYAVELIYFCHERKAKIFYGKSLQNAILPFQFLFNVETVTLRFC